MEEQKLNCYKNSYFRDGYDGTFCSSLREGCIMKKTMNENIASLFSFLPPIFLYLFYGTKVVKYRFLYS